MLTSKQRAKLKAVASKTDALYQLGSKGINDNYITQINSALDANEIVKIHILDNNFDDRGAIAAELAGRTDSEVVQVIGSKLVLYKKSRRPEKRKLSLEIDKIK